MTQKKQKMNDNFIFGLDIGTRSVVGVVGYKLDSGFQIVAHVMIEHDTRAMIDGQIHDVSKVAETIIQVKKELETILGMTLHKACIAAAGRVLKTAMIHVEQEVDQVNMIDEGQVNALELLGMERAHKEVNADLDSHEMGYHCVGYTVSKYYLNDYEISSLLDHKGKKIGADVLATFLPQEVVESLYQVVQEADMEVYSLTLEPIAAINVAIPHQFRLLNIALVDIGAGTSDVAITKDGSIIAYGMIPMAGDELTEAIVHHYLVDFNTAETIKKKATTKSKTVTFKDVIGIKHTIPLEDVKLVMEETMKQLAKKIGDKIMTLNSGRSTNAIFVVGGGGLVPGFTNMLSEAVGLSPDRVALRGKEVLDAFDFGDLKVKKGPDLVTPIGICLTGLENNKHDFIQVYLNDEPIRIYDNNRLTVMDVAAFKGVDPKTLIARRGNNLEFKVNGNPRRVPGEAGQQALIMVNNDEVSLTNQIKMNDYITIIPAKQGKDANMSTYQLLSQLDLKVFFEGTTYPLTPQVVVNGQVMTMNYDIKDQDDVRLKLPTLDSFLIQHDLDDAAYKFFVNGSEATDKTDLADQDHITRRHREDIKVVSNKGTTSHEIFVSINKTPVKLSGKESYVFVDIFDVYPFDLSRPQGNVVCTINGQKANYMGSIQDGDALEVYWEKVNQ